jgi:hypothetical protein
MGGKRKKLKDILSPSPSTPPPAPTVEDDELLNDLLAQLDSNDKTVQNTSAELIGDIQLSQLQEKEEPQKQKKDSKTRFLERQVCVFLLAPVAQTKTPSPRREKLQGSLNTNLRTILSWMPR